MSAAFYPETVRQRLFKSARGLTCLFWAVLTASAGFWAMDAARLKGGALLAVGLLFAIPLLCGMVVLGTAMAGMRRSAGFAVFVALSAALIGLSPFGAFWRMHPDVGYFVWNALALYAAWLAWLSTACWMVHRYAADLGDPSLAFEAVLAGVMTPVFGVGVAVLLGVALVRNGMVLSPGNVLRAFGAMTPGARLVAGFPFVATAYTLWLGKESGYRRLMGG